MSLETCPNMPELGQYRSSASNILFVFYFKSSSKKVEINLRELHITKGYVM